jgi:hypothetical protein
MSPVLMGLPDSENMDHFACHGIQDRSTPTESALLLAGNSQLTLSTIIQLNLPHADLAFLPACQTATGNKGSDFTIFILHFLRRSRFNFCPGFDPPSLRATFVSMHLSDTLYVADKVFVPEPF